MPLAKLISNCAAAKPLVGAISEAMMHALLCVIKTSKMKYFSLLWMLLFAGSVSAQHIVYLTDGSRMPGKITEITAHKIKFKNLEDLTGPTYSRSIDEIAFAFNATGSYLVFAAEGGALAKKEKEDFINPPLRSIAADILVDINGGIVPATIASENETELICTAAKGKKNKVPKATLCFVIRRNGTHQVFVDAKQALPILLKSKESINSLLAGTPAATTAAVPASAPSKTDKNVPAKTPNEGAKVSTSAASYPVDKKVFEKKALDRVLELEDNIKKIVAVKANKIAAQKAINLSCELFTDEEAKVEVSIANNPTRRKFKIRDYLNRLMILSTQFDEVKIDYAEVNYASKFTLGTDGNYHGIVSFVQSYKASTDGKKIYGDITERTVEVIVKPYKKEINGESVMAWDVMLGDMGVTETK